MLKSVDGPNDGGASTTNGRGHILQPGRNVWRIERAKRAAVLVDAKDYYRRLEQSLGAARRSVWIVGWDFNARIKLRPDDPGCPTLGEFLRGLVEQNGELQIHVLIWALGLIYSQKKLNLSPAREWADHSRIHVRLDSRHPLRASHHQKLVCIDDTVAFAGGIDLTVKRWDSSEHLPRDPARRTPDGDPYPPVHDVQMAVEGDAARMLGDVARQRWRAATGEEPTAVNAVWTCWPDDLAADLTDTTIAVARTRPRLPGRRSRHEAAELNFDALRSARRCIYVEAQYFASATVGRILAARLKEIDGPEIVILVTRRSHGLFERLVMGGNRDRLIRRLRRADRFGRLRVMYPVVADPAEGGDCEILIHSKVMIVDDSFLRVGSSNLNNRSEGLDTECDLAIEAQDGPERRVIASLRDRLVAEHLGTTPGTVSAAIRREGSLVRAIDRLNHGARGLRNFEVGSDGRTALMPGTGLVDPKRPYWPLQKLRDRLKGLAGRFSGRAS